MPLTTFENNKIIVAAALTLLNQPLTLFNQRKDSIPPLEHRIEKIGTYNDIEIYNDSKATIMESTIAALDTLQGKSVILLLGGISKGVDRKPALTKIKNKVKKIVCFGSEAHALHTHAQNLSIESSSFSTLEDAYSYALLHAKKEDTILFSPGGASYDLFKNYEERGNYFKKLVYASLNTIVPCKK